MRASRKRSDRRYIDEHGLGWASQYEAQVYYELIDEGYDVRRCEKGGSDTFDYETKVIGGLCPSCGTTAVVQRRTYTPDILVYGHAGTSFLRPFYLEVKGHFPPARRSLIRSFLETGESIDLRIILYRNGKATKKRSLGEYIDSYLKVPWHVWTPNAKHDNDILPPEWGHSDFYSSGG